MKNLRFLYLAAFIVAVVSLSSCDDFFYDDGLSGHWECVSFQNYAISHDDYHEYNNFSNHDGYMDAYDYNGYWVRYYYKWWTTNRHTIVFDWDKSYGGEPAEYYYDFDHGFLYLTDVYDPNRYWSYQRK